MSTRNLLHRNKVGEFEAWLRSNGYQLRHPKGDWEVLRWVGPPGRPMPIVFDRLKGDHLTANSIAENYVRQFIQDNQR